MVQSEAYELIQTIRITAGRFFIFVLLVLLFSLSACCPPYCGERYGTDYYCMLQITTIPKGDEYVAQINGEGFNNLELDVRSSEFVTTCSGELEITKNYAELIKKNPSDFKVIMRNNCSMAIVRSN